MSIDPARLLQMLEPTVRPGNAPGASGAQSVGKPAFENRSFKELLSEASQTTSSGAEAGKPGAASADALSALSGLGRIENAALRGVLAQASQSGKGSR